MKIYSVSAANYPPKTLRKISLNSNNVNFKGKHTARNIGLGAGSVVSLVGFGLWNLATGGVPLLITALAAGGTAAAGAFGDMIDKACEEDDNKK